MPYLNALQSHHVYDFVKRRRGTGYPNHLIYGGQERTHKQRASDRRIHDSEGFYLILNMLIDLILIYDDF